MNFNNIQSDMNESIIFDKTLKQVKTNKININDDRKEKEKIINKKKTPSIITYKENEKLIE